MVYYKTVSGSIYVVDSGLQKFKKVGSGKSWESYVDYLPPHKSIGEGYSSLVIGTHYDPKGNLRGVVTSPVRKVFYQQRCAVG